MTEGYNSDSKEAVIKIEEIDVVCADDELVFQEIAQRQLVMAGFKEEHIHMCGGGSQALESIKRLQTEGSLSGPLMCFVDMMMPNMDGKQCGQQIQDLIKSGDIWREPFVVCISSALIQDIKQKNKDIFQAVVPKPLSKANISECLAILKNWWKPKRQETNSLPIAPPQAFSLEDIDVIVGDDEPISCMNMAMAWARAGIPNDKIVQVDEMDEIGDAVGKASEAASQSPFVLVVTEQWRCKMQQLRDAAKGGGKRQSFIIGALSDTDDLDTFSVSDAGKQYDALLPASFSQPDILRCLDKLRESCSA